MAHVATWTVEDVAAWVDQGLHLPYGGIFIEAAIDGSQLLHLGSDRLWELGIDDPAHRTRLLNHVEALRVAQQHGAAVAAAGAPLEAADEATKLSSVRSGSMGSTGGTYTGQPIVFLRPDEDEEDDQAQEEELEQQLEPSSLAAGAGASSISSPDFISSSCAAPVGSFASCTAASTAPRLTRSGIPITPVMLSQYPRVGSPTVAPVTPRGAGRRRAAPAAAGAQGAMTVGVPGHGPPGQAAHSSPQPRAKSQQRRSQGSSSCRRQSGGGPGLASGEHKREVPPQEAPLPDGCGGSSSSAFFEHVGGAESEALPATSRASSMKVVPGLALGTSQGSASLSTTVGGGLSSSGATQAPCPSPRLASPRCLADTTPLFTPRTGHETVSRCSSAPTYRSKRGPSIAAAEGASLFLSDQSKGAHFGSASRNLDKPSTTLGPGPAGYNTSGKTAKKAAQADRSPSARFGLDPRRTMESMYMRGEAGPGAGKYNPPLRRSSRGGSISRAARWGARRHANGPVDRGGIPQPHAAPTPGPMTYRPNYSALSTVK
eukprot:TRINITY_DN24504_c0_g2_i1.p1 TRINITY_DN24504_c0_g2~~TRINITY_DN24504_c0_g2_i1.p1  ORF type:complete len:571 (-),score=66.84 TRINITY_DN24504_c0_g2_i1:35-1666(-)